VSTSNGGRTDVEWEAPRLVPLGQVDGADADCGPGSVVTGTCSSGTGANADCGTGADTEADCAVGDGVTIFCTTGGNHGP